MNRSDFISLLPKHVWWLTAAYFVASFAHFAHNAEYIAFYPKMPSWLTREHVYLFWLGVTSIGALALCMLRMGFYVLGVSLLSLYGSLGLYGLAHYTLALCSEHTLAANVTIWSEAILGFLLMLASASLIGRRRIRAQKLGLEIESGS